MQKESVTVDLEVPQNKEYANMNERSKAVNVLDLFCPIGNCRRHFRVGTKNGFNAYSNKKRREFGYG